MEGKKVKSFLLPFFFNKNLPYLIWLEVRQKKNKIPYLPYLIWMCY